MTHPSIKARATRILKKIEHTENWLSGHDHLGYFFDIKRESNGFYIIVLALNGMHIYNGFWYPERNEHKTMREAVIEAIDGAMLVCPKVKLEITSEESL